MTEQQNELLNKLYFVRDLLEEKADALANHAMLEHEFMALEKRHDVSTAHKHAIELKMWQENARVKTLSDRLDQNAGHWFPSSYFSLTAVDFFIDVIKRSRADSFEVLVIIYEKAKQNERTAALRQEQALQAEQARRIDEAQRTKEAYRVEEARRAEDARRAEEQERHARRQEELLEEIARNQRREQRQREELHEADLRFRNFQAFLHGFDR